MKEKGRRLVVVNTNPRKNVSDTVSGTATRRSVAGGGSGANIGDTETGILAEMSEMFELRKTSTPWLIFVKQMFYEFTVKNPITLLSGLIFKKNDLSKPVTDIKRSTDSDNEFLLDEDGNAVLDEEGNKTPDPLYVPVNDETLPTTRYSEDRFLNKTKDDRSKGKISSDAGFEVGEFIRSLYAGKGAGVDKDGNAEVESIRVRGYAEFMELIINRLSAIEGDQLLTEGDTIDRVVDLGDNCYGLYLRSKWEGYFTAQYPNNVLKGVINTLATGSGKYYTCWMRVNSVNTANNYIEVTLYPDEDTPAGRNFPPCEMMNIARWGNAADERRQSCLYLSSTEGRIVRLTGVTKPIIDASNYGSTIGELPEFLKGMDLPIVEGQDYLYARGIVVQDMIRMDYQGKPISTIADRGLWEEGGAYYSGDVNPVTGEYEISDVWYMGCKWRCAKTGTATAPAWNNTDWAMVEGNPEFTVGFEDTDTLFDPDRFELTLRIAAKLYNMDITEDILDADVQWTRYSEDAAGVERVASDNAWALKRANEGKSIRLTADDCDFNGYVPKVLRFIATVTLRDGTGEERGKAAAVFEY